MATKTKQPSKQMLIRQYHAIANNLGMTNDDRREFLQQWNVESSKDLTTAQLIEVCRSLAQRPYTQGNVWRKRVLAAIFHWFSLINKDVDTEYVKGVACRAARYNNFNDIPGDKLKSIYNTFTHKCKIFVNTGEIINHEYDNLQFRN